MELDKALPEGWVAGVDPHYNRTYYYNKRTRRSTWTKPMLEEAFHGLSLVKEKEKQEREDSFGATSASTSADDTQDDVFYVRAESRKKNRYSEEKESSMAQYTQIPMADSPRKNLSTVAEVNRSVTRKKNKNNKKDPWVEVFSPEHNRTYFYNRVTHESVWIDPRKRVSQSPRSNSRRLHMDNYDDERKASSGSAGVLPNAEVIGQIPALQSAWKQIEEARVQLQKEREEHAARMRTEWKLLQAQLQELKELRKASAFTPSNSPRDTAGLGTENLNDENEKDQDGGVEVDNSENSGKGRHERNRRSSAMGLTNELENYARDLERRTESIGRHPDLASSPRARSSSIEAAKRAEEVNRLNGTQRFNSSPPEKFNYAEEALAIYNGTMEEQLESIQKELDAVEKEFEAKREAERKAAECEEGDYYLVLGVERDATPGQLKKAYHKLMMKWHPDKNRENTEEAVKRSAQAQDAYQVLFDPWERDIYDWLGLEQYLIHAKVIQCFKNYMWSGVPVKKIPRNGRLGHWPKVRFMWLDHEAKFINTGRRRILEATDKQLEKIKGIEIAKITEIRRGRSTELLEKYGSRWKESRYLSIISPERTLDLLVDSHEQREFLATRLALLVIDLQRNKEWLHRVYDEEDLLKKRRLKARKAKAEKKRKEREKQRQEQMEKQRQNSKRTGRKARRRQSDDEDEDNENSE